MWIDTTVEMVLWTLFIIFLFMSYGIESEQRVRESWLMSLKNPKAVSVAELKAFNEKESADCNKKKNRWFWGSWIILGLLLIVHYSSS